MQRSFGELLSSRDVPVRGGERRKEVQDLVDSRSINDLRRDKNYSILSVPLRLSVDTDSKPTSDGRPNTEADRLRMRMLIGVIQKVN